MITKLKLCCTTARCTCLWLQVSGVDERKGHVVAAAFDALVVQGALERDGDLAAREDAHVAVARAPSAVVPGRRRIHHRVQLPARAAVRAPVQGVVRARQGLVQRKAGMPVVD